MTDSTYTETQLLETTPWSTGLTFVLTTESSDWKCYMFGNRPGRQGIIYTPAKEQVPNRFVRFMMRVCFDCLWVKEESDD